VRRRGTAALAALAAALVAALAGSGGEPAAGEGFEIVNPKLEIEGWIKPAVLPRRKPAPARLRFGIDLTQLATEPKPALRRMVVDLDRHVRIDARGLPRCRPSLLRGVRSGRAMRLCGGALVGRGRVQALFESEGEWPFAPEASLLAFNGPRRDGLETLVLHASTRTLAPTKFVAVTKVGRARGSRYGRRLRIDLPRFDGGARVTAAHLRLNRRWRDGRKGRSYVRASCRHRRLTGRMQLKFRDADDLTGGFTRSCRTAKRGVSSFAGGL
jgi:hypothetical protein